MLQGARAEKHEARCRRPKGLPRRKRVEKVEVGVDETTRSMSEEDVGGGATRFGGEESEQHNSSSSRSTHRPADFHSSGVSVRRKQTQIS